MIVSDSTSHLWLGDWFFLFLRPLFERDGCKGRERVGVGAFLIKFSFTKMLEELKEKFGWCGWKSLSLPSAFEKRDCSLRG